MIYHLETCQKVSFRWKGIRGLLQLITGGKMPKRKTEKSLEEIITDAEKSIARTKKRRGFFIVISIILFLLLVIYGYVLFRQRLLDLDAEAYIRAVQTATARSQDMGDVTEGFDLTEGDPEDDLMFEELDEEAQQTLEVQLTEAPEALLVLTPEP